MRTLEVLNFLKCGEDYKLLADCWARGFKYEQAAKTLRDACRVYIAEDQYDCFCKLVNTQVDIDIGVRRGELEG